MSPVVACWASTAPKGLLADTGAASTERQRPTCASATPNSVTDDSAHTGAAYSAAQASRTRVLFILLSLTFTTGESAAA
jgi:hypothetical protein